jgi:8-oxo-dGTP pyrophosphatase MutT (NUDIX family)
MPPLSLPSVIDVMTGHKPSKLLARRMLRRCAVNLLLRDDGGHDVELLMIQRAERDGDPWSGQMGFPGGRMDEGDQNIFATAMREMHEEVGIEASRFELLGRLSDLMTRSNVWHKPMVITPFVGRLQGDYFNANHEVAGVVWIPLTFLADVSNRQAMPYKGHGMSLKLPCYVYDNKRIWGLSLTMIDELLRLLMPALPLEQYDAPLRR